MARRRQPPEPPVDDDPYGLPEHLRRCVVEDWIGEDEGPEPNTLEWPRPTTRTEWAMVAARTRFVRARVAWAREHGIDHRDLTVAYGACGRPTFQDRAAFVAADIAWPGRGSSDALGAGRASRKDAPCPR